VVGDALHVAGTRSGLDEEVPADDGGADDGVGTGPPEFPRVLPVVTGCSRPARRCIWPGRRTRPTTGPPLRTTATTPGGERDDLGGIGDESAGGGSDSGDPGTNGSDDDSDRERRE